MKKILLSMAAIATLGAAAAPAAAQPWRGDYDRNDRYEGQRFTGRYDALEWQINAAARERRLSWGEARDLLAQWRDNQPLAWRVETGRASGYERQRVLTTMNRIERALERSQRYSRYDRDDRYGGDWRR
jgi:opacity protein-like surface antigen